MSARTGKASAFGGAKHRVSKLESPWGRVKAKARNGVHGSRPRGSSTSRPTPDASLRSMSYPKNDPTQWPLENPQTRADLRRDSAMTQGKADWQNGVVNHAYQRGGYAG
jgi:hypothetical protein